MIAVMVDIIARWGILGSRGGEVAAPVLVIVFIVSSGFRTTRDRSPNSPADDVIVPQSPGEVGPEGLRWYPLAALLLRLNGITCNSHARSFLASRHELTLPRMMPAYTGAHKQQMPVADAISERVRVATLSQLRNLPKSLSPRPQLPDRRQVRMI